MYDSAKSLKQSPGMRELIPVITKDEIGEVVNRLALEISSDYHRRDLILIFVLKGSDVLIIEDIVDTGLTAAYLIDYLKSLGPNTVKICALIDKHERRKTDIQIYYVGCQVEDGFWVGYGLDYAECYRNLPEIRKLQL